MDSQDTIRRVRYFDRQLLQVQDFTDEQAYHIRMRRIHNRFLHSFGVLDGLELHLDPHGRILTVEEGIGLDEQGREIVLPAQETIDLTSQAGRTLYVTIGYRERESAPGALPGAGGFARVEEYPQLVLSEAPPRAGEMLILGRVTVGPDGAATALGDGEFPYQRRNSGGAGGDLEGRTLTLSGPGGAAEWPRLRMSEPRTAGLEGTLKVGGDLRVAGRASVAVELGVGTETPKAKLQVVHLPQDSGGDALVLGPVEGTNLRMGYHQDYSWIQSHGSRPLRINELENDISLATHGRGRVGIGTDAPTHALHVAAPDDGVARFESRGSTAYVSLSTREGPESRVELAARPQGRLSLWVSGGGDVVNVTRDGRVGVGTEYPTHRFHVRSDDPVGLFESIGEQAYLRIATREGMENRVELANRPGGRLALFTAGGGDVLNVTRDGQVGVGTAEPQGRLHVAGDLVVDGEIRSRAAGDEARRWSARPNGLVFEGAVGIGVADPEAKLQVVHTPQDSNGDTLVLGPEGASNLRLGYHHDYSWIQSHGQKPLRINELGNDVIVGLAGGNLGVGTEQPQSRLHVRGDVFVEGTIRTAAGELTPGGGGAPAPAATGPFALGPGGNVSLGGDPGDDRLHVHGALRVLTDSNPIRFTGGWTGFPDGATNQAEISNDVGNYKTLMIVGNKAGGGNLRRVGIWDRLDVNGSLGVSGDAALGGDLHFGTRTRQMLNLWTQEYGIGIQGGTQYFRTGANFAWFRGGAHHDGTFNPGGGTAVMVLTGDGNLGLGSSAPTARLHVEGDVFVSGRIRTAAGEVAPGGGGGAPGPAGAPGGEASGNLVIGSSQGERFILHGRPGNKGDYFQITGDDAAGNWEWGKGLTIRRGGNVGIGTNNPQARLQVAGGALMPSAGNGEAAGILFPPDAGGGAGDRAWMRYYARTGEAMTLELGTSNDPDDHIALMPSGSVGIGTPEPKAKLHVRGDVFVEGTIRTAAGELTPGGGGGGAPLPAGGPSAQVRRMLTVGPTTIPEAEGRLHLSGPSNELSLMDRGTPQLQGRAGQRYVLYVDKGRARFWTEETGDVMSFAPDGLDLVGDLDFGARVRQMLNLWKQEYGIGVQSGTQYFRTGRNFAWFQGGAHHDGELNPGGGKALMVLNGDGNLGVGSNVAQARVHVMHTPQDSNGNALILGPTGGANLRMGYHQDYSWIQSHGAKPLRINELGNDVLFNANGGNVGIGIAPSPAARLHVRGDVLVEGNIRTAAGVLTPGGGGGGGALGGDVQGDITAGGPKGQRFIFHTRTNGGGDFLQITGDDAAGNWEWGKGVTFRRGGNVGIGTTSPQARLQVAGGALMPSAGNGEGAGILFPPDAGGGAGDRAWMRYYARTGEAMTLELGTSNDPDDHIALMPTGSVGIGVNDPSHRLHVRGTDSVALFQSTGKMAYLGVSANNDLNDRVEFCNRGNGQLALWVPDAKGDALVMSRDGRMILGRAQPPGTPAKPQGDVEIRGHTVFGGPNGDAGARVVIRGELVVEGPMRVAGPKQGYLADQFVNVTGDTLEEGDVVVIGDTQAALFYGERGNIPIPEVDLTDRALDRRICGVVAEAHPGDDTEGMQPVSTARKRRGAGAGAAEDPEDPRQVAPGQRGVMVTMGAFAHCKVDADLGAIEVGDLLTTSPTKGHAQKVTDPTQATGAILGKALAPLKKGQGKIAVMVMLH